MLFSIPFHKFSLPHYTVLMRFSSPKMHEIQSFPGLGPGPHWGSLKRSPDPRAGGEGLAASSPRNPPPLSALQASSVGPSGLTLSIPTFYSTAPPMAPTRTRQLRTGSGSERRGYRAAAHPAITFLNAWVVVEGVVQGVPSESSASLQKGSGIGRAELSSLFGGLAGTGQ